jgi:hypothetical protein
MANPEGEAESEAVRLDFDRRLTPVSWFRGHVRPMCAIVIPFPRTPGNARLVGLIHSDDSQAGSCGKSDPRLTGG